MADPYRTPHVTDAPRPQAELVYVARERDVNAAFHRMWIRTVFFGFGGTAFMALAGYPSLGPFVLLAVFAWSFVSWRRTRHGDAFVFRVDRGDLTVSPRRGGAPLLALPLASLCDVKLDTRSVSPVMRNTSVESLGIGNTVRGEIDVARVILVPLPPRESVSLSEDHLAHMDAVEGVGKIRTFLRSHGWLPEDERA